jgi:hypothetical protein
MPAPAAANHAAPAPGYAARDSDRHSGNASPPSGLRTIGQTTIATGPCRSRTMRPVIAIWAASICKKKGGIRL